MSPCRSLLWGAVLLLCPWPLGAKGKDRALDPSPADPTLTYEYRVSSGWRDTQAPGLDWALGSGEPRLGFGLEALVPLSPEPGSGLVLQGSGRGRFAAKDPSGAKPFLGLVRTEGAALVGGRWAWTLDGLGTKGKADLLTGVRFETALDGDDDLVPSTADRGAFWTRVMPQGGLDLHSVTKSGPLRWELRGTSFLGADAEKAYGRDWPAMVTVSARTELTLRVVGFGAFEGRLGFGGRAGWDSGVAASRWEDREDLLVDLLWGQHFTLRLVPVRSDLQADGGTAGTRTGESEAEAAVDAGTRTLTFGVSATWEAVPALGLWVDWKEAF